MSEQPQYLSRLESDVVPIVAAHSADVDKLGQFPDAGIKSLAQAGLAGLISSQDVGGIGQGPRAAVEVVERLARECGSTAMVACMHYAATAVLEKHGPMDARREAASGRALATLAFSESGSRSQFWAPVSTAKKVANGVQLDASKSWVTSAGKAQLYVWSSRPVAAEGMSTIWLVPAGTKGVQIAGGFDGLGLRGNESRPISAQGAVIPEANRLGPDGAGLGVMLEVVLPIFNMMTAAVSVGLMEAATARTIAHVSAGKFEHTRSTIADLPTVRAFVARMRIQTDQARLLLMDTVGAAEQGRPDVMLRVLECKAAAGEAATTVLDTAMRVCGGAAFRKEVGVDRYFRDGRAGSVMAPTTDQLYDFIGKAVCGMPVF